MVTDPRDIDAPVHKGGDQTPATRVQWSPEQATTST
jgi:hypothetical protein